MDLIKHLAKDMIFLDIEATDKWSLLKKIVDRICLADNFKKLGISCTNLKESIIEREREIPTGLGEGVAFPHIRHPELDTMLISFVVLKKAVPFDSIDGKPVNIVCLVLAPDHEPTLALKVRSRLVSLLSDISFRSRLINADTPETIYEIFKNQMVDLDVPITAQDIMSTNVITCTPNTPLKKVTRIMSINRTNAIAVVDNDKMVGEITCDILFGFGMPAFFSELKTVSFISEFDPFEKYFHAESHIFAKDIMTDDFKLCDRHTSLLEIVFALVVLKYTKIYIQTNDKLVGEIDQILVLDNIMRL